MEAVSSEIQKVTAPQIKEAAPTSLKASRGRHELLEERLLTLAFQDDPEVLLGRDISQLIRSNYAKRLIGEYQKFSKKEKFDPEKFGKALPKELFDGFASIIMSVEAENEHSPDRIKKELDLVVKELKILSIKEDLKDLSKKVGELEKAGEKEQMLLAQNKFTKLTGLLSKLDEEGIGSIILDED